jgi:O-6-methylguanine DNA methyltransferase
MSTKSTELDELAARSIEGLVDQLGQEPDPAFLRRLRGDTRAAHARALRRLGWFDLEIPVGKLRVVHDGELVHLVTNDPANFDAHADRHLGFEPPHRPLESVARKVATILAGRGLGSDLAYLGGLPAFQRGVLRTTASIPRGEVRPYGWVARQAGNAGAVRAAGTALGHNPVPFIVPCHRVVRSDWRLGEYSAGGPAVKDRILLWEGCDIRRYEALPPRVRFIGDRTGRYFCLPACGGILEQPAETTISFHDADEALAAGYEPCDVCLPV